MTKKCFSTTGSLMALKIHGCFFQRQRPQTNINFIPSQQIKMKKQILFELFRFTIWTDSGSIFSIVCKKCVAQIRVIESGLFALRCYMVLCNSYQKGKCSFGDEHCQISVYILTFVLLCRKWIDALQKAE